MTMQKQYSHTSALPKSGSKSYGRIVLTLKNCLLPEDKLSPTPSQIDGLDQDTEIDLRILGCELIQTAGILLKLPQVAMATAQVLFQRFYYSKSFVRHAMETTAMGCLCLASKIEEAPRRIRDVINVLQHVKQVKGQRTIQPIVLDQNYIALKTQVIKAERRVLKELGFCVHVRHPHKIIVMYLQVLGFLSHQSLMQNAWNYMNDSLRTDVFVRYQPETVACACIYLTSRKLSICLPKNPAWFSIFGVLEKDIKDVCFRILRLYQRAKVRMRKAIIAPNAEELEKRVEELRRYYQEARLKARVSTSTGNTSSSQNFYSASGKRNSSPQSRNGSTSTRSKDKHHNAMSPRRNSHTLNKHRSRSRSRTLSRSPHSSKYTKKSRKKREKSHYHSRSRSRESRRVTNQSRSPSYEHYDPKHYVKSGHRPRSNKHSSRGTERDSRERERVRNKDRK
ncbi:unnamed protein product [Timema podura]|uniref:Cyclin-like domain-containing protein n=1 Tax=Timema podura TaxID=61482 RepID=A0ABN7NIZ7_TIMPD|nr:unnamed protein product [Timema podura]